MRRTAGLAMAALCSMGALGQSALDCIDPDVWHSLLRGTPGEPVMVVSSSLPQEMAGVRMPGSFTWIGSAERNPGVAGMGAATRVAAGWHTTLKPENALSAATAALAGQGWEIRRPVSSVGAVFRSAAPLPPTMACRDDKALNIATSPLDGTTYLLISVQRGQNNTICNQPLPMGMTRSPLDAYLPRLDLPVDPATGSQPAAGGGGSSSGNYEAARAEFAFGGSATDIARHLASQMAGQGWIADASWGGPSTAGSTWSRPGDADAVLLGTLAVSAVGGGRFQAVLRVQILK